MLREIFSRNRKLITVRKVFLISSARNFSPIKNLSKNKKNLLESEKNYQSRNISHLNITLLIYRPCS